MAGSDGGQEKTEEATPKKLREARKKGQVAKSRDLTTVVVLIFVFITLCFAVGWMGDTVKVFMQHAFNAVGKELTPAELLDVGKSAILSLVKMLTPVLLVGFIVAYFTGMLQVGGLFSTEPLKPNIKKLNMIEGLKNMFKAHTVIELFKTMIKIVAIFVLAYYTLRYDLYTVLQSTRIPVENSISLTGWILFKFLLRVLILFLIIAVIDFAIQRKQFLKQMKMTKDEVKREYKQDEGDPLIKSTRKQIHREFAFGDVKQAVKQADAVVTNPVHVAVAIRYDREEMVAPEIVARGQLAFAQTIKDLAEEFEVPIIRNVALAWALVELEVGDEIPEDLYGAVAEILSYIYRLKQEKEQGGQSEPEYL